MQILHTGQPVLHKVVSLHKRIKAPEPPTYWLTITMPWKQRLYDVNEDEIILKRPKWCFGFRFWVA